MSPQHGHRFDLHECYSTHKSFMKSDQDTKSQVIGRFWVNRGKKG